MINLEKEIRTQPEVLRGIEKVNLPIVEALVNEAKKRGVKHICFAARGTSDHASIYAQYLFGVYAGVQCSLATPSVISVYDGKLRFEDTLLIGVSQSGKAEDVLTVMNRAKECGQLVAALTNDEESPMAKVADYHLFCSAGSETSIAATKTFTAQMYLLALLCEKWCGHEIENGFLRALPDAAAELLSYMPERIGEVIARYKDMLGAVVLGRGMLYPIALEGALKVLETNNMKMKGYAVSDFYHGPLAQVAPCDPVILLAAKGPMMNDTLKMLARLDEINADAIVITDDEALAASRSIAFKTPDLHCDAGAAFMFAITMQLIALKLTEIRGIDPDASKVLRKVTITK